MAYLIASPRARVASLGLAGLLLAPGCSTGDRGPGPSFSSDGTTVSTSGTSESTTDSGADTTNESEADTTDATNEADTTNAESESTGGDGDGDGDGDASSGDGDGDAGGDGDGDASTGDGDGDGDACAFATGGVWINEFHYDNTGADVGEFIELAGQAGIDLASCYEIELYNGFDGGVYGTLSFSGSIPDESGGFGALSGTPSEFQNGNPDGLALVHKPSGSVVEFLSYSGPLTATDGAANGMTSVDVGVSESSTGPTTVSLQLTGTGSSAGDFTWTGPSTSSSGSINDGQTIQ